MIVVGGESLIDLVPEAGADQPLRFEAHAGGSPYNCAIALAKLGGQSGFLCPISQDAFGDMLLAPLRDAGVSQLLNERVSAPSSLAVVSLDEKGAAQYEFYREADRAFTRDGLVAALPEQLDVFQIGGFCTILADDAVVWLDVAKAAIAKGAIISMDPNVRPSLVDDFAAYKTRLEAFFEIAHIIKLSDDDLMALDDTKTVAEHAAQLLTHKNCQLVVVTKGESGSVAFSRSAQGEADVFMTGTFGDTVGAGDSLMAGILAWLGDHDALAPAALNALSGDQLADMLRFGAIVAGLNCEHKGCHPPMRTEVDAVLTRT